MLSSVREKSEYDMMSQLGMQFLFFWILFVVWMLSVRVLEPFVHSHSCFVSSGIVTSVIAYLVLFPGRGKNKRSLQQ